MISIVPVTAMPYAEPSAVDEPKPSTAAITATQQRPVDGRHVDLADFARRRVHDAHARQEAELHRLLGHRDTRRRSPPARRSPSRRSRAATIGSSAQSGKSRKNGFSSASGSSQQQRALAEVVERERRQHEGEPRQADRPRAEVAHVGVQRLGAGHAPARPRRARRTRASGDAPQKGEAFERIRCAARIAGARAIGASADTASTTNQSTITGPNTAPMPAVPCFCIVKQRDQHRRRDQLQHVGLRDAAPRPPGLRPPTAPRSPA